jgi:signal transduction histidine kinase
MVPEGRGPTSTSIDFSLLDAAWQQAVAGSPRIILVSDPLDRGLENLLASWLENMGRDGADVLRFDFRRKAVGPFSPFLDLLARRFAGMTPEQAARILDAAGLYHRHQLLFRMALGMDESDGSGLVEDIILEEVPMERRLFLGELRALLALACDGPASLVVCRGAELLGGESLELIRSFDSGARGNFMVVLDFDRPPPGAESETFFREYAARGQINILSRRSGPARYPLEDPRQHGMLIELLLHFLCFGTVLRMTQDAEPSVPVAIWRARCHEAREDYEEALLELQNILLTEANSLPRERCALLRLASRQYRYLNDPEMAVRLAVQASEAAAAMGDDVEMARADFMQFLLSSVAVMDADTIEALEERLGRNLARQGWLNHRAYLLGQSAAALRVMHRRGAPASLARCAEAVRLARFTRNNRRLGTCMQATAIVLQASGQPAAADRCFRRIYRKYGEVVLPQELARAYNGHGFLLFSTGQYQRALRSHARALNLLKLTRHFEETLVTALNVARIQLFGGWPAQGRELLEAVLVVLDILRIKDLPFMERQTVDALLGIACIKSGQGAAAQEIERRLLNDYHADAPNPHSAAYTAWLQALLAAASGREGQAATHWDSCHGYFRRMPDELRYLAVPVLSDEARWQAARGDHAAARRTRMEALACCLPPPFHLADRAILEAELAGLPPPDPPRLRQVALDSQTILDSVQQDVRLRAWRRTARSSGFLRAWQELLNTEHDLCRLLAECRSLLKRFFLADEVSLDEPAAMPAGLVLRFGAEPAWLEGEALAGTGLRTASWIPCTNPELVMPACFLGSRRGSAFYSLDDHRVVLIALRYLETTLLARQRSDELEHRQAALEQANGRLSVALEQLIIAQSQLIQSEKMAALGSLVAGIAHEINTPLGIAVTGVSHLLEKSKLAEHSFQGGGLTRGDLEGLFSDLRDGGDIVMRNLSRADRLIQNFKQVATDQTSEEQRRFMLREYLEEVLSSIEPTWKKSTVKVTLEGPQELEMDSYPGALAQIVTNLVMNALIHAFEPGRAGTVRISVATGPRDGIDLVCADDGKGIAASQLGRIFDPFYTTRRNQGGTGLGLHIAFNLVHQVLGGTISCESEPGRGAAFRLWFPRAAPRRPGSGDPVQAD